MDINSLIFQWLRSINSTTEQSFPISFPEKVLCLETTLEYNEYSGWNESCFVYHASLSGVATSARANGTGFTPTAIYVLAIGY